MNASPEAMDQVVCYREVLTDETVLAMLSETLLRLIR